MNVKSNKIQYEKAYIITKDKDENDLIDAKEYFESPDKFLSINPKISIGVSPNKRNYNLKKKENKTISSLQTKTIQKNSQDNLLLLSRNSSNTSAKLLINNQIVKTEQPRRKFSILSYEEKHGLKKMELNNINTHTNINKLNVKNIDIINKKKYLTLDSKDYIHNIHYQFKTFKDLKQIFKDSMKREKYFKFKGTNDLIPIRTDSDTKKKFISQEKRLKFNQTTKSNEEKFLKYLAKKCKKDENDLLIKSIEDFRMKKQLKEYVENDKKLQEKFGDNYWLFSLRRGDKNDFLRLNYYNVGNNDREIWKRFIDYPDRDIELINDPYNKTKNKIPILFNFNKNYKGKIHKMPNIKGISDIKVEGKNLAIKEYKDIVDITQSNNNICKFKMYKDPKENNKNYVNNFTCREVYKFHDINTKNKNNNKFFDSHGKHKKNYRYFSK